MQRRGLSEKVISVTLYGAMQDISEFTTQTPYYELVCHLSEKVVEGEIKSFSELRAYTKKVPHCRLTRKVFEKIFEHIRKIYWGMFSQLDFRTYPKLWERLVMPDLAYPFAGDLKRNMTITEVFIGLIDIHGYTRFCESNRRNLSMLELLDEVLQNDITSLSIQCGVLSRRCRGDEVILIGASAEDVLEATLNIASYFSRRQILRKEKVDKRRPGYKVILPDLSLSAGIAGGQKYTPLVITQDGDISGGAVNEAARIQSRANKLAPDTNKILISNHAYGNLVRNGAIERLSESTGEELTFFNSGLIEFKGTSIGVYDVIFNETERFRVKYADAVAKLFESVSNHRWNRGIFVDLLAAIKAMAESMPAFSMKSPKPPKIITNTGLSQWCEVISKRFSEDDFECAIEEFTSLTEMLVAIPQVDPLIAEYAAEARLRYGAILEQYKREIDEFIAGHPEAILSPDEHETYLKVQQHYEMYKQFRIYARSKERQRKQLWRRIIENTMNSLELPIRSLKE